MSIRVLEIGSAAIGLIVIGSALAYYIRSDSPSYLNHEPQVTQGPYSDYTEWEHMSSQGPSQGPAESRLPPSQGGTRRKVKRSKRNKNRML
jgi:hypothetical protein